MAIDKPFIFYTKSIQAKSVTENGEKKYFVKGHIDSGDLDLVNDIVTKECMTDISQQFKSRSIKLDFDHETLRAENGETDLDMKLNLSKIPLGKSISEKLDEKGNEVQFQLNPDWKKFDSKGNVVMTFQEVWNNIKSGFFDAFSIAYVPVKTAYKSINEAKARLLDKVNLLNVALTGNPINPSATMTNVMAKSLEYMKSKENRGNTMEDTDKKKKEDYKEEDESSKKEGKSQTQEKSENNTEQKSIEQKAFAELKSDVNDLKSSIDKINKILEKAIPKSKGAEDKSKKQEQKSQETEVKSSSTLDLI